MKNTIHNMLAAGLVLTFLSCDSSRAVDNQQGTVATDNTAATNQTATPEATYTDGTDNIESEQTAAADTAFVAKASRGNMAEVKLGMLAERKAMDYDVKEFARQMIQDHRNTNSVLMNIARPRHWRTPENMTTRQKELYDRLETIERTQFDKAYLDAMVKEHEEMIAMFEEAANTVTVTELKEYIANTTPALREHLNRARSLRAKIK